MQDMAQHPSNIPDAGGARRLATTLRTWRRQNNIKQAALAQMLGVSQPAIARWESGLDQPSNTHIAQLHNLMMKTMRDDFVLQKLFIARQSAIRSLIDFDDMSIVEVSAGFRQLWPDSSALLNTALRDDLVNEAHVIANDPNIRRQILDGSIGLISGVSTRQMRLEIDTAIRHRWHICFRRFGLRTYADMVYEPCEQDAMPGVSDIIHFDARPA